MCVSCGVCILKYIFFLVNLVLTLFGLGVVAAGIVVLVQVPILQLPAIVVIVVGGIISIIFFLGCCGAVIRNNCMLISYTIIIIILATLTVVLTVNVSNSKGTINEYITSTALNDTDAMAAIEYNFECCGLTGPDSYGNNSLPMTCCPVSISNVENIQTVIANSDTNIQNIQTDITDITSCTVDNAHKTGCLDSVLGLINDALNTVVNVLICICIGEYLAAATAIALTCYNRSQQKKHRRY